MAADYNERIVIWGVKMKQSKQVAANFLSSNPWVVSEESFQTENNYLGETIFALGNGYIGMRGNFEEGYQGPKGTSLLGIYLNGFYESSPIQYGEIAYGYAKNYQTMLNVTNSKIIELEVDGEKFNLFSGKILKYYRELNMQTGILTREIIWASKSGKQLKITIKRVVSLINKHLAAIQYQVTPLNFSGKIKLISGLDTAVTNQKCEDDPRVGSAFKGQVLKLVDKKITNDYSAVKQKTTTTQFELACAMSNEILKASFQKTQLEEEQKIFEIFNIDGKQDETITLTKWISYFTSIDYPQNDLFILSEQTIQEAKQKGFNSLLVDQKAYLADFWKHSEIQIVGDLALEQGLRFNQFHLLQSVGKDGKTSIASKGVTGEGYEGHYFWDTESFVLPSFLYTKPEIAKQLLMYRYNTLDKARERARQMSYSKGALYAWRTINGEECSAYYPAGTAQYHINADIIQALKLYIEATSDIDFLLNYGAEMLFETARLWASLGDFIPSKENKFCVNCVTGPDEYTAIVNNNFYTNMMAQSHLYYAYKIATLLQEEHPLQFSQITKKIQLEIKEITNWQQAAEKMYLPYDEKLKIHPQDDTFLQKKKWDFESVPKENYPLLLHYHPLVIYRYQVCKQADVIMADFWFGNKISLADKQRDYDYYEPITTHDSSLSPCCFSIMASEVGYCTKAYDYFMQTARLDLDNLHHNSEHGIHAANMAGAWMCMAFGFAGMRTYEGFLSFSPILPDAWQAYRLTINFQNRLINVNVNENTIIFNLLKGSSLRIECFSKPITLQINIPSIVERYIGAELPV